MMLFKEYRVKDLFNVYSGATPSSKVGSYWDGDITWITPADMSDFGYISNGENSITRSGYESCGTTIVPEGSIILSSRAPIGKINLAATPMCTNQGCKSLVPKNDTVNVKFVAYYLFNNVNDIDSLGQGTTFKELPLKRISSYQILLPSFKEQQRIVDYLDEKTSAIDTQIELLGKKKDAYARLKKAMINRAVTRGLDEHVKLKDSGVEWIGMIPEHWQVKRIKDVCNVVCGATPKDNSLFWDGSIIWISPADMVEFGEIKNGARTITEQGYKSCGTSLVPEGSIVMSTRAPIGKTNIALNELCTNQGCKCLTSKKLNMRFMLYCIWSKKEQFQALGRGTTFIELSTKDLSLFRIAIPPLEEQVSIASFLDEKCTKIDAAIANIDKQTDALKRLKRSVINEVITGQRAV